MTAAALQAPRAWVPDRQFGIWPYVLAGLSMFYASVPDGFDYSGLDLLSQEVQNQTYSGGSLARQLQWAPMFALGGYLMWRRWTLSLLLLKTMNLWLLLYTGWVCLSIVWSIDPASTLRKAIQMVGLLLIAGGAQVASWRPDSFQSVMRLVLGAVLLASLAAVILFPTLGVHQEYLPELKDAWRGITGHKNGLGPVASLSTVLWVHALLSGERPLRWCVPGLLLSLLMLAGARSSTSILVMLIGVTVVTVMIKSPPILRWAPLRLAGAMILVTVLFGALIVIGVPSLEQLMNPVAGAFGKNLTFSGRTLIWAAVLQEAFEHPWLGTGYGAFWQGNMAGTPSGELIRGIGFTVWQSHNGYIDVFNETGVIGLFLLISNLTAHLVMAGKVSRFDRGSAALHAAIGLCFILINLAENNFRMVHAGFTVYFLSSLTLARLLLQQRLLAMAPRNGQAS